MPRHLRYACEHQRWGNDLSCRCLETSHEHARAKPQAGPTIQASLEGRIAELEAAYNQMYSEMAAENSSMENDIGHVNKVNVVGMQRLAQAKTVLGATHLMALSGDGLKQCTQRS